MLKTPSFALFWKGQPRCCPFLRQVPIHRINMASKDAPVEISEEEEDQWVGARPQNPEEVRSYSEKVDTVFEMFSETSHK